MTVDRPSADLLLTGFGELATLQGPPGPRAGPAQGEVGRLADAAVASDGGRIVWVGPRRAARQAVRLRTGATVEDLGGALGVPGFVDAHTHVLFAGSREDELPRKVRGESYLAIAASGGGLFRTVRETRSASTPALLREAQARLERMRAWGTTAAEVKSGYDLTVAGELRLLDLVPVLARRTGLRLVPTALGGHALPPEEVGHRERFLRSLVEGLLPEVARRGSARFCDIFCEEGFFTARESERVLRAGQKVGLGAKIHADEFSVTGGAAVAARLHAVSADHLLETPARDRRALARSGTLAVLLPVTPLASLAASRSRGREFVDAGVPVALGTDLSPNSWVESMPAVLAHAVHGGRLTPAEALVGATVNAAHASGLGGVAGVLAPGRDLDLAVFDLPSLEHLPYRWGTLPPRAVYRAGRRVPEPSGRLR